MSADIPDFPDMKKVRVFSFGGGVQSTSVLALQIMGKLPLPYDYFIFSNVGHDSENPATIEYMSQYIKPLGLEHNIPFVTVQKTRYGEPDTLVATIVRENRSVPIPAYMGMGAPGNRSCTLEFKVKVVDRWIKQRGYTHAVIGLGISLDEYTRVRSTDWKREEGSYKFAFWKMREYPLIELRLNRKHCVAIIKEIGLPTPPKSACFFCPFKKRSEWIEMKRTAPQLFEAAVAIEHRINEKRDSFEKDRVYLHRDLVPLEQAVGDQMPMFPDEEDDACETGYCMT